MLVIQYTINLKIGCQLRIKIICLPFFVPFLLFFFNESFYIYFLQSYKKKNNRLVNVLYYILNSLNVDENVLPSVMTLCITSFFFLY
jgi:hypothetical protein